MPQLPAFGLPLPLDQPFSGLVLLTGHAGVLRLSQLLCLQYLRSGHPVVLVDAANGFDALLLSEETAVGAHPIDAVAELRQIAEAVEASPWYSAVRTRRTFGV